MTSRTIQKLAVIIVWCIKLKLGIKTCTGEYIRSGRSEDRTPCKKVMKNWIAAIYTSDLGEDTCQPISGDTWMANETYSDLVFPCVWNNAEVFIILLVISIEFYVFLKINCQQIDSDLENQETVKKQSMSGLLTDSGDSFLTADETLHQFNPINSGKPIAEVAPYKQDEATFVNLTEASPLLLTDFGRELVQDDSPPNQVVILLRRSWPVDINTEG